ncbi:MAG TPA: FAD:protein FMN transferase [Victivallales bacterium]|nr:FAD:protein FMN transferase [Victivallales bacterium]
MNGKLFFRFFIFALIIVLAGMLVGKLMKKKSRIDTISRSIPVMSTVLEIKLYGDPKRLASAADAAAKEIERIEKVFSIFGEGEATKINESAGKKPFKCSDEMWDILKKSEEFHKLSGRAFDVSIRPMMLLWGFYRKRDQFPSDKEIEETLAKIGFEKIILNEKDKSIFFSNPDMSLDFGGIVKGYAVDRAVAKIESLGVRSGLVNLGGNIRVLPEPPPGKKHYDIGIRHPKMKDDICGVARISGGRALATSGNYERYIILKDKHITHIINPSNGRPVEKMISVTVITSDAISADAMSTSVFVGGETLARKIVSDRPGTEFLIIMSDSDGKTRIIKIGESWSNILL